MNVEVVMVYSLRQGITYVRVDGEEFRTVFNSSGDLLITESRLTHQSEGRRQGFLPIDVPPAYRAAIVEAARKAMVVARLMGKDKWAP